MRRVAVVILALVSVAACSDNRGEPVAPTTTTTPPSTSARAATTTTTTSPPTTTTTAAPASTTTSGGFSSSVRIEGPTLVGTSPVECNAPTMVELRWKVSGASAVEMRIDGEKFASYRDGTYSELLPLECDGRAHTYTLVATADDGSAQRSIRVATRRSA